MKIEWASSFRKDGSRRRPPPSTMHGWLAKMRGTLIGDETLRSKGIQEMKQAKQNKAKRKQYRANNGGGLFSFLTSSRKKGPARTLSRGIPQHRPTPQHRPSNHRPAMPHKKSSGGASRASRGSARQRPGIRPRASHTRRRSDR